MPNLRDYLKGKLTEKESRLFRRAFDIVGDIAVVEIPRELAKKQKAIAAAILEMHKNIKSVYMELGGRKGKLRLQKLKWLAGEKGTETVAAENGIRLKLDVEKVYFSPRMSTERKRIYQQVKKGESVLVMFSGAAPYVVEVAKLTGAKAVYGVEINRVAHKYAVENAKLNKVEAKTRLFCGDVNKIVPQLKLKFDRIVMPLPKGAEAFLGIALAAAKKNATIHFYDFEKEEDIPTAAVAKVKAAAAEAKRKVRIVGVVKCGQLAPRAYRVCVDFKVI